MGDFENKKWLVGAVISVIGLLLFLYGGFRYASKGIQYGSYVQTQGVVVGMDVYRPTTVSSHKKTSYSPIMEYYADGNAYRCMDSVYTYNYYADGTAFNVYYDPKDPSRATLHRADTLGRTLAIVGVWVFFIGLFIIELLTVAGDPKLHEIYGNLTIGALMAVFCAGIFLLSGAKFNILTAILGIFFLIGLYCMGFGFSLYLKKKRNPDEW